MRFLKELKLSSSVESHPAAPEAPKRQKLSEASAEAEKQALTSALIGSRYNKTLAAQTLGISRNKLYKKLREYNLLSPHDGD